MIDKSFDLMYHGGSPEVPMLVARENVHLVWPHISERVGAAIDSVGFYDVDLFYVEQALLRGEAQLWLSHDAKMLAITRIVRYPMVVRLVIDLIEGENLSNYTQLLDTIEAWAVGHGATQTEAHLRKGLTKLSQSLGFRHEKNVVYKTIARSLN